MIRWFRNWRRRRRERFCAHVRALGVHASAELRAQLHAECEREVLAELERARSAEKRKWDGVQIPDEWKRR